MSKDTLNNRMVPRQEVELEDVALVGGDDLWAEDESVCFDDDGFCCYPEKGDGEHGEKPCREGGLCG